MQKDRQMAQDMDSTNSVDVKQTPASVHQQIARRFDVNVYHAPFHPHLWNIRFFPKSLSSKYSTHETAACDPRAPLVIVDTSEGVPAIVFVPGDWQEAEIAPEDYKAEALRQIEHRQHSACHIPPAV